MEVTNYLLKKNNINIVQNTEMFNFSLDSILLPNFVTINKNISNILDIGCGNAPIPLILSTKTNANIIGVEIQKEVYNLAIKSVKINNLESQISILNKDINEYEKEFDHEFFDVITCNPPFFKVMENSLYKRDIHKTFARHELTLNLNDIFRISKKLLKNNGVVAIVHRPERMLEIFETMKNNNIEPKKLQFVYPKKGKEANIILVEGRKNGNPGIRILPPLIVHEENGNYTQIVKNFFE
ncbi:MAG: tRNA1(Val) (adenine(37)-N6)-methyltransferase [Clostridium sp.]|nr:tRNA1(Val) (adenine(37)-N6)-methyltransferase [Clostridium sp.]MCM1443783.1 tRNA1(Val) (adenine(37)-N6)-methyltransferase [Candidatus Amulumruptor caecigallinarius]